MSDGQALLLRNTDCTNSVFLDFIERSLSYHICRIHKEKETIEMKYLVI